MNYVRILTDDRRYPDRWFLGEPRAVTGDEVDAREFIDGRPYVGPQVATVPIEHPGRKVAFNLAAFDMPVVSTQVAEIIRAIARSEVESFPVSVENNSDYEILNVICTEDCLDERRSKVMKWTREDGRPEKIGQYRMVIDLTIDPLRANNHHLFRIEGWEIALIASEDLKIAIGAIKDLGIVFQPVVKH